MVRRRKPLVLSSTKILVNSVLSSTRLNEADLTNLSAEGLRLKAGILKFPKDKNNISDPKLASLDDSALVGLSTSALKRLSITSGSLVSLSFCFWLIKKMREKENNGTFSLIHLWFTSISLWLLYHNCSFILSSVWLLGKCFKGKENWTYFF